MGSFKCNLCNRPMPPRVYEFHLKKSHTPEEVKELPEGPIKSQLIERQIEANENELKVLGYHSSTKKEFDWGPVYPCHSCGAEYPAKAMPWHAKQAHGV